MKKSRVSPSSLRNSKKILEKVFNTATNNFRYRWGVNIFEDYLKKNPDFYDEKLFCKLGLLYDHLALQHPSQRKSYEKKALQIYRAVLSRNPDSPNAVWGIGRVWWHRKDKRAIPYALRAYQLAKRSKPQGIGLYAQGVGLVYEALGDYRRAKKWLIKGPREDPKNWGVYLNLVIFYRLIREFDKAKRYAKILARLFRKEPPRFKRTAWGKKIKKVIANAGVELPRIVKVKKKKGNHRIS